MKKIIVIFTVLAFTCLSSECLAQKVTSYTVGAYSYVVINNATLPLGAIKTKLEVDGQKISATGQMDSHNEKAEINKKVSPRFAVSKSDVNSAGEAGEAVSATMAWVAASTACVNYTEGGKTDVPTSNWRLPTQRELMLIYQMKAELEALETDPQFTVFADDEYWSATKNSDSSNAWYVNFSNGRVSSSSNANNNVRCIRDL